MKRNIYPSVSEMDKLKDFIKRSPTDLSSYTYSSVTRNPKPTEEEKELFIKQHGVKHS